MKASFMKGVVLGSVVGTVVLFGTAAFAGGGVGAIFTLGKVNAVNATTELAGSTNGRQLDVVNTSTGSSASGIGIRVHSNRPPLTVNSSTKVSNLNADLLDGLDSSRFQRRVTSQCSNGTAVATISADGTVGCTSSAVYPIYHSTSIVSADFSDTFGGSGLTLISQCFSSTVVGLGFSSTNASTGGDMFTTDQSSGSTVGHISLSAGEEIVGNQPGSELADQIVWVTTTGAFPVYTRWIATINVHKSESASGCEISGTAEVATSRLTLGKGK
jgi:hypothetical protein